MANVYGKNVYITTSKTGTVTLTNPAHGTIAASKTSGLVGETIILTSSMQTNYYISKYLVNSTAISGNSFKLVEGENAVTCEEYYQAPSVGETEYTLTCQYYLDDVLSSSRTKTYAIKANAIVNPSNYETDISNYDFVSVDPISSFVMTGNRTIKLYYEKQEEINPFDYITVTNYNDLYLRIVLANDGPIDSVDLTSSGGTVQNGTLTNSISFNGTITKTMSGRTNDFNLSAVTYYSIRLSCTYNGTAYSKTFTYGTYLTKLNSPYITKERTSYDNTSGQTFFQWRVRNTNDVSVTFHYTIDGGTVFSTTIPSTSYEIISELLYTSSSTLRGYFSSSNPSYADSSYSSLTLTHTIIEETYYTLTVVQYDPTGTVYKTNTYEIKEGTVVDPNDYLPTAPSGWVIGEYAPKTSFTMSRDRTISVNFEDEEGDKLTHADFRVYENIGYNDYGGYSELRICVETDDPIGRERMITISNGGVESKAGQFQISGSGVGYAQTEYVEVSGEYTWSVSVDIDGVGVENYRGGGTAT